MFNTPILFLIFNKEDTTQKVFEEIRKQKPKSLYVASDGPRVSKQGEREQVLKVREVINQVDWNCEIKTLFREENLGCKLAVSSAIDWFFNHVEQGIILEDDCLPNPSFFPFCEELLEKYKDDERIGHIGGNCYFPELIPADRSYDFSHTTHIWGWATWRRVWKNYDVNFPYWEENKHKPEKKKELFVDKREEIYFSSFLSDTLSGKNGINAWSVQYLFMLRLQNQLSIYPSVNLVSNIGLASDNATHTTKKKQHLYYPSFEIGFPLRHSHSFLPNKELDKKTIRHFCFSYKRLHRYFLHNY